MEQLRAFALALRFNHSSFYLQKTYDVPASGRFD
jgi:hypothetical protein